MKLNLSTLLLILGGLGAFAPDVASVAAWLASTHLTWLVLPAKAIGFVAVLFAAAPLIVPRIRSFLALLGLATPPGALAPWTPGKPGDPDAPKPADEAVTKPATPVAIAAEIAKGSLPKRTVDRGSVEWWTIGLMLGVTLLALGAILLCAPPAKADTAAPWAGHCFGDGTSTCLVPELSFDVSRIALNGPNAGKLQAGAVPLGAGYVLLFGYDQWYAFGPAVHAILDLSQSGSSMVQVSGTVTVFRYAHGGISYVREGSANSLFAVVGLTVPIDLVTTNMAKSKAMKVRAMRAQQPVDEKAAVQP